MCPSLVIKIVGPSLRKILMVKKSDYSMKKMNKLELQHVKSLEFVTLIFIARNSGTR